MKNLRKRKDNDMTKYKCPKCGMKFDEPGKCTMCNIDLVEEVGKSVPTEQITEKKQKINDLK